MTIQTYADFLAAKRIADPMTGIADPGALPDFLFPHQRDIVRWALKRGRAAIFAGTGLGKTLMELVWAREVARHTARPVLLLAPLAVSHQHIREAGSFGLEATIVSAQGVETVPVANYQKLDRFDLPRFGGIALDESSILKSTDGHYRTKLIRDCATIPFRLAATATPAPNDFMELGNHAEFLGVMSVTSMLATFFVHDASDTKTWRLKGHAEDEFWRWMASWAVMLRKPSDLGYSDEGYDLPPLTLTEHPVKIDRPFVDHDGQASFLPIIAERLSDRLAARRDSVGDRVARAVNLTPADDFMVWWCNLNSESQAITRAIPGAVEVSGADSDDAKERKLRDFSEGKFRVLVTKPTIAGFGMNWQHCCETGFVGLTDSYEQIYQALRRFWRFGQKRPVHGRFIFAETEGAVIRNYRRKEADAERMAAAMVRHMADLSAAAIHEQARDRPDYQPAAPVTLPHWGEFA